jgi:hypothetical protein
MTYVPPTEADYDALRLEIMAVEKANPDKWGMPAYLFDESVDAENVPEGITPDDADYWPAMYSSACSAAGGRAEERGLDINKLLGKVIY